MQFQYPSALNRANQNRGMSTQEKMIMQSFFTGMQAIVTQSPGLAVSQRNTNMTRRV
jgi:hypothetical protein